MDSSLDLCPLVSFIFLRKVIYPNLRSLILKWSSIRILGIESKASFDYSFHIINHKDTHMIKISTLYAQRLLLMHKESFKLKD